MHMCLWEVAISWNKLMMKLNGFLSLQFSGMNTNERVVADSKNQKYVPALTQHACPSYPQEAGGAQGPPPRWGLPWAEGVCS